MQSQFQQFGQGQPMGGPLVAPTGRGSGFMQSSGRFLNTSRYYSRRAVRGGGRR
jgi:hypothetical protein